MKKKKKKLLKSVAAAQQMKVKPKATCGKTRCKAKKARRKPTSVPTRKLKKKINNLSKRKSK